MGVLNDAAIRILGLSGYITPFQPELVSRLHNKGLISFGVSSYGYDATLADEFKVFHNAGATFIDPKAFDQSIFIERRGVSSILIPPNSFALARTVEYFKIPRNCIAILCAKSTYARCGLVVNCTALEPEWEGTITLELSNTTPLPIKVYAHEGIIQVLYLTADSVCDVSYADRSGKFQYQQDITLPMV